MKDICDGSSYPAYCMRCSCDKQTDKQKQPWILGQETRALFLAVTLTLHDIEQVTVLLWALVPQVSQERAGRGDVLRTHLALSFLDFQGPGICSWS